MVPSPTTNGSRCSQWYLSNGDCRAKDELAFAVSQKKIVRHKRAFIEGHGPAASCTIAEWLWFVTSNSAPARNT